MPSGVSSALEALRKVREGKASALESFVEKHEPRLITVSDEDYARIQAEQATNFIVDDGE